MNASDIKIGLTYDDVLLIPQKSSILSRSIVDTHTQFTRHIQLAIPFVSSNIDTVTEKSMAIAMAKLGGIGVVHRFMSIEDQVKKIDSIKRSEGFVMGNPFTLSPNESVRAARQKLKIAGVSSAIIVERKGIVVGLISARDLWFLEDDNMLVEKIMTPRAKLITSHPTITAKEAKKLFRVHKIEKIPLLHTNGTLAGLITSRTVLSEERMPHSTKDATGRLRVAASVGVVGDYLDRAKALIKAGVDAIVVDVAHIHSTHGILAVKKIRRIAQNIDIVAGNIATAAAAQDLVACDVDAVKVGIGPGGICITRMVAGAGVPQLTALLDVARICGKAKIPVIADGGTNYPGDMSKAIAAGASTVMLAGWLAGTDESPGNIILRKGQKYKVHRGAASYTAIAARSMNAVGGQARKEILEQDQYEPTPEGVETFIPYKGTVVDVIAQLTSALRSGMSYSNATTVPQMWKHARFMQITSAGFRESREHNIEEI